VPVVRRPTIALSVLATAFASAVLPANGDPTPDSLRNQIDSARAREQSLSAQVANLGGAAARLERQLGVLERRRGEVRADLATDRTKLAQVQDALRAERERLTRLRARLGQVRRTLANRLVAAYKAPQADLTTVVITSQSLSDLLERTRFMKDVQARDRLILRVVRAARGDAAKQARQLAVDEARQRDAVVALKVRAKALAGMSAAVDKRRATLVRIRATRAAALSATRANRQRVESRLASVEREIAAQVAQPPLPPLGAAVERAWAA